MDFNFLLIAIIEGGAVCTFIMSAVRPKNETWAKRSLLVANFIFYVLSCLILSVNVLRMGVTPIGLTWGELIRIPQVLIFVFVGGMAIQGGVVRFVLQVILTDILMMLSELVSQSIYITVMHLPHTKLLVYSEYTPALFFLTIVFVLLFMLVPMKLYKWILDRGWERYLVAKIATVAYLVGGFSKVFTQNTLIGTNKTQMVINIISIMGFLIGILLAIFRTRYLEDREELLSLAMSNQIQEEYQEIMKVQLWKLRLFRHDIKNHISILQHVEQGSAMNENDVLQLQQYKEQLRDMYEQLCGGDYCENRDFNVCMYQLEKFCKERGIAFAAKLRNIDVNSWNEADLYKICMTLLDDVISRVVTVQLASESILIEGQKAAGHNVLRLKLQNFPETKERNHPNKKLSELSSLLKKYDGDVVLKRENKDKDLIYRMDWN